MKQKVEKSYNGILLVVILVLQGIIYKKTGYKNTEDNYWSYIFSFSNSIRLLGPDLSFLHYQ